MIFNFFVFKGQLLDVIDFYFLKGSLKMYLNIGGDAIIDDCNIIGIFDLDKTTVFKVNRNYLSNMEKRGKIVNAGDKLPKSFVLCDDKGEETVYIGPLLPITLLKRNNIT